MSHFTRFEKELLACVALIMLAFGVWASSL